MNWDGDAPTRVHILSLRDPSQVVVHELPPFMFFHVAQAAVCKDPGGPARLEVDLCAYDGPSILDALSLERLLSDEVLPADARLLRLELPLPGEAGRPRS